MSSGLLTLPGEATGVALILVDEAGENSIAVAGGANAGARLRPGPGRPEAPRLKRGDVVLVGHEIPTGATHEALASRPHRQGHHDPEPGPGPRPGAPDAGARRHPDPERGRARGARRRPAAVRSAQAKRLLGAEPGERAVLVSLGADGRAARRREEDPGDGRAHGRRRRYGRGRRHAQRGAGGRAGGRAWTSLRRHAAPGRGLARGDEAGCPRGHADRCRTRGCARRLPGGQRPRRPRWRPRSSVPGRRVSSRAPHRR